MPPPSRLARVSRFRLRLPLASRFVFPSLPLPLVFVLAGPLSPPFEKALVFFSIVSQTFSPFDGGDVRMSDDCSFLSLSNPHFLIFLFLITASRPFISPKLSPKFSLILQIQALFFRVPAKIKCTRKSRI